MDAFLGAPGVPGGLLGEHVATVEAAAERQASAALSLAPQGFQGPCQW